jgi:hypothetical protein
MSTYHEVRRQVENLTVDEQFRLLGELVAIVHRQVIPKPAESKRSILELQGLGKEIWKGIDAQEYINQERDSWNA